MTDSGSSGFDDGVDISVAHDLLSAGVRRAALHDLCNRPSTQVSLSALAASLTDRLSDPDEQSLRSMLHHTHLPKLDAAGVVDYHPDRKTIDYDGDPTIEGLLDADAAE